MRHYQMGYGEVMRLPVRVFWMLNSTVGRLLAEEDIRHMQVTSSAQSVDGFKSKSESLLIEMGEMFKSGESALIHAERDEIGFAELKMM
jgi:hypothetical protein